MISRFAELFGTFKINSGEFVFLIGKTGSGKSSLIKTLYGESILSAGNGNVVGFDLKTFASGDIDQIKNMSALGFKTLFDLYTFPRPVVAAISGHAVALGIFVVCCCDYRIGIDGEFVVQANEVRNNMDIPVPIMEIAASRVDKQHIYRALFHADPYKMSDAVSAGWIDEVVSSPDDLMKRAMEKAEDLATLGHPMYQKTKEVFQHDIVEKIQSNLPNPSDSPSFVSV